MRRRFTGKSRTTRGSIPKMMRTEIYLRDKFTCQFCQNSPDKDELTIDHLIPLALGGLDEVTNYVTCCLSCNRRKADRSLEEFAREVDIKIEDIPVHGDPVIDNHEMPIQIRLIRKRIFDQIRQGTIQVGGKSAQKKIEKAYRREFWSTEIGQKLEAEEPLLPGHVRIMIPEIKTIANTPREYALLVELAKSAHTRELIGSILLSDMDIENRVRSIAGRNKNPRLEKRLNHALRRFNKVVRSWAVQD